MARQVARVSVLRETVLAPLATGTFNAVHTAPTTVTHGLPGHAKQTHGYAKASSVIEILIRVESNENK